MQDLISVIVPVYNVEPYLEQCLDSIINQTYKNLEILLINDGSTDKSGEICEQYASQDERIRVVHQDNRGQAYARNVGLGLVRGAYISFVDSDDQLENTFFEVLLHALKRYDVEIAVCHYHRYDDDSQQIYYQGQSDGSEELLAQKAYWERHATHDIIAQPFVTVWGKLYRRELFDLISFPTGRIMEDVATLHRLFLQVDRFVLVKRELYLYRIRANSTLTSTDLLIKRAEDMCLAYERRMSDLLLAGGDLHLGLQSFVYILQFLKEQLEQDGSQESAVYRDIVYRLALFEKKF